MARTEPFDTAADDEADLPYQGIGADLRAAREAATQSIDLVASTLRIRRPHIQAIEEGRFQDLPGQVYAIGFVRAYAEYLHLDANLAVERFREQSDGPGAKFELHFPEPAARRSRLDIRALALGLLIAAGAYGTWHYLQTRGELPRELVAMVPADLVVTAEDALVEPPTTEPANPTGSTETTTAPEAIADSVRSMVGAAISAVETKRAENAEAGSEDAPDRADTDPSDASDPGLAPAGTMFRAPTAPGATALRTPNGRVSEVDDAGASRIPAAPRVLRPGAQAPGTEIVQRLTENGAEVAPDDEGLVEDQAIPSEASVSAVMVGALRIDDDTPVTPESEAQVPPISQTVGNFWSGDSVDEQPGSATPITGALAEAPEAPTLIENEVPGVPATPGATYEPHIYGQGNTDVRIVVRARIESWVQIEGSNNELLLTRVLNPGDMFLVPNRGDLHLVTGNAGGIEILVDGVLMPPLGPEGTVRRNVQLTPDALTGSDTVSSR